MTTLRWTLTEVDTAATWTMPINPDTMTSPFPAKNFKTAYGIRKGLDRVRGVVTPPSAREWEWGGVIRTKEHYDALVEWANKPGAIHVADHLGRVFEVYIHAFEPQDRQPTATVPWRLRYTVKALVMRRVS